MPEPASPEELPQETGLPEPMSPDEIDQQMDEAGPYASSQILYQNTVAKIEETFVKAHKMDEVNPDELKPHIEQILDHSRDHAGNLEILRQIEDYDANLYQHSIHMCTLALLYAEYRDFSRSKSIDLAMAAMLHDIGKIKLPRDLITQCDPLTPDCPEVFERHTHKGYEILQESGFDKKICRTALQHHERPNGNGYPRQATDLPRFSKILIVINYYDNLTNEYGPDKIFSPKRAFYSLRKEFGDFSAMRPIVHDFMRCLNFYPVGSFVRLTNDEIGVVHESRDQEPMYPKIYIIRNRMGDWIGEPYPVDLKAIQNQKTSIQGVIYDDTVEILETVSPDEIDEWDDDRVQDILRNLG